MLLKNPNGVRFAPSTTKRIEETPRISHPPSASILYPRSQEPNTKIALSRTIKDYANLHYISDQFLDKSQHRHYRIVIGITSAPANLQHRNTMRRDSWLAKTKAKYPNILWRFLIGNSSSDTQTTAIQEEMKQEGDILWLNFMVEKYTNMTMKLMTWFQWLAYHANNYEDFSFDWVMKTCDDTWVNINSIYNELENMAPVKCVWGYILVNGPTLKIVGHRNSDFEFVASVYPPYPSGAGYLLSNDIAFWLALQWEEGWLWTWANDDAGLGIYLSGNNPTMKHDPRFDHWGLCTFQETLMFHSVGVAEMISSEINWNMCKNPCKC